MLVVNSEVINFMNYSLVMPLLRQQFYPTNFRERKSLGNSPMVRVSPKCGLVLVETFGKPLKGEWSQWSHLSSEMPSAACLSQMIHLFVKPNGEALGPKKVEHGRAQVLLARTPCLIELVLEPVWICVEPVVAHPMAFYHQYVYYNI